MMQATAAIASVKPVQMGNILIVDDESDVRFMVRDILECKGYQCAVAACSEEALSLFGEFSVDLVITDLHLAESRHSGMELIDMIRAIDECVPVILITGYPSISRVVDAMKRGAIDFLTKPFDIDLLLHQVANALQERRLRMENRRLQAEVNKTAVIEKLNRELDVRIQELTRLYAISEGLNEFLDSASLFDRIVRLSAEVTGAQRISVMVLDHSRRYLKIRAALGLPARVIARTIVTVGEGIAGQVALTGKAIRTSQHVANPLLSVSPGGSKEYVSQSWLSLPLLIGQELFGVINLTNKVDGSDFTREDELIMCSLVEKAGIKLENQALYEGIYSNLIDTLTSLVTTIEAKDPYTREHSQRVTDYAVGLATYMGLSEDEIEMVGFAGMLHDIGKIGVRDEILTKAGKLSDEEYMMIKMHPVIGERIVQPLGLVDEEKSIIRHHHERYDGKGYPDGLGGNDIPLLARVVGVTDAFDAMTSTRSYRKALSKKVALDEMRRCSGSQFDPELVEAWIRIVETKAVPISLPRDPTRG
jgi:response regulator RpfG family c-di-GMP phosphodiesterase